MSKESEALNRLASFDKKCEFIPKQMEDDFRLVEQALKRNEPMKVRIVSYTNGAFIRYECSNCNVTIDNGVYCPYCGQHLDWGGYIK